MLQDFLCRHGMSPDQVDVAAVCQRFYDDMTSGLAGQPASMLMLPTYLTHEGELPKNLPVAVIDAGGTNARVARVVMTASGPVVEAHTVFPMPGSLHEISRQEFFDTFADALLPIIEPCAAIGFCFSFPAEITPQRDGKVLYFDKEVRVSDSEGMLLIEGLTAALAQRGITGLTGVVLNDTAAALLGGLSQISSAEYDGILGLIWGTGINLCYAEPAASIAALGGEGHGTMLINTESGAFTGLTSGDYDRELDAASKDPGRHPYEKMVSGAYLGEVIRRTIVGAAREGLLSESFLTLNTLTTPQANNFLLGKWEDNPLVSLCRTDDDWTGLRDIIDALCLRAAKLVGANLAAAILRSDAGKDTDHPVCIVVEGSTFYKSVLLRPHLEAVLDEYVVETLGRHYAFLKPENANLLGTAAAALLNR